MKRRIPPEDVLVESLKRRFATRRRDVKLGIGDDAAVVDAGAPIVLTTDALIEGEDFFPDAEPRLVGRKALAVNLSDVAAMGATPLHALLAIGLPRDSDPGWIESFAEGVRSVAQEFGVAVVGGDLSASPVRSIVVTVVGRCSSRGPLTRAGGQPGDELFVSGTIGAAAAGLALLRRGYRLDAEGSLRLPGRTRDPEPAHTELRRLLRHQLNPRPHVALGRALADSRIASAAIDISDGLARDLHRLCRASGVGARLHAAALPVDTALRLLRRRIGQDPRSLALFGGEDYGLLFSVPRDRLERVRRIAGRFAIRRIGTLDRTQGVTLVEGGRAEPLPDAGFDHFEERAG